MDILRRVTTAFQTQFGSPPDAIVRAPGRVNLLGEHVDYNEGVVLPIAIDMATYTAVRKSRQPFSTIIALDLNQQVTFSKTSIQNKQDTDGNSLPEWALYPAGMQFVLTERELESTDIEAVFSSSIPMGSGLSSSAAVEMGFGMAWKSLGGWELENLELAKIGQQAENNYVGVQCGLMDQFASLCGTEGRILSLDCRSLEWETFPFPEKTSLVIADTTVRHHLPGGAYNENRRICQEAVRVLEKYKPGVNSLRDVSPVEFERLSDFLPERMENKARFVIEEMERVRNAKTYLQNRDVDSLGALMFACHDGLRNLFGVSCRELDIMVDSARKIQGCLGARLTGAGFGGCTVNLVEETRVESFMEVLALEYRTKTGLVPHIYICQASAGAEIL